MSSKTDDVVIRFKHVQSRTPLYQSHDLKFYWSHCWYCGKEIFHSLSDKKEHNSFTRDHVIPASHGGGKGVNTVPACYSCNCKKQDMTLEQYRKHRNKGNGKLFYGERCELELKEKQKNKQLNVRIEYKLIPLRCYVGRELIFHTVLSRLMRKIFK